jgi:hypothetical protein
MIPLAEQVDGGFCHFHLCRFWMSDAPDAEITTIVL